MPGLVQRLHHLLELAHDLAAGPGARVGGLGGEEGHRLVAPEVAQRLAGEQVAARVVALLELRDRHQLDGGDAQLLEVRDLLDDAAEGAGVRDTRARVTGEAADVDLVDHRVGERHVQRLLVTPVELLLDDPRAQALRADPWPSPPRPTARGRPPPCRRDRSAPGCGRSAAAAARGSARSPRGSRTRSRGRCHARGRARRRRSCCTCGRAAARARARSRRAGRARASDRSRAARRRRS